MELREAIETRRTVKEFTAQPVPSEPLERALSAGLWAQNHRLTEPWRFAVLGPETSAQLAERFPKAADKPCVVVVSCIKSDGGTQEREDYAAVACAVQNIGLAAWELGLGMQWSSGLMATGGHIYEIADADPQRETVVGLLFFGFPREVPPAKARKPLANVCRFLP